jgi:hypothetical protein
MTKVVVRNDATAAILSIDQRDNGEEDGKEREPVAGGYISCSESRSDARTRDGYNAPEFDRQLGDMGPELSNISCCQRAF